MKLPTKTSFPKMPSLNADGLASFFKKKASPQLQQDKVDASRNSLRQFFEKIGFDLKVKETPSYFSTAVMEKALTTFDKAAVIIIGVSWLVALVVMGLTYVAVRDAADLKAKAETARGLEPVLPKIVRLPLLRGQYDPILARLKKQFPTLTFDITSTPGLKISSSNPEEYMNWLNAISYMDSMISTVRWTLSTFCVGMECPGEAVMQTELTAEAINITQPQ